LDGACIRDACLTRSSEEVDRLRKRWAYLRSDPVIFRDLRDGAFGWAAHGNWIIPRTFLSSASALPKPGFCLFRRHPAQKDAASGLQHGGRRWVDRPLRKERTESKSNYILPELALSLYEPLRGPCGLRLNRPSAVNKTHPRNSIRDGAHNDGKTTRLPLTCRTRMRSQRGGAIDLGRRRGVRVGSLFIPMA